MVHPRVLLALALAGCASRAPAPTEAPAPTVEAAPGAAQVAQVAVGPGGCPVVDDAEAAARTRAALEIAAASPERSEKNRARNEARRPVDTLMFFGLRDDHTVLELWPGGGWYTEVLAPVLAERGRLIATNYDPDGPEEVATTRYGRNFRDRLAASPSLFQGVQVEVVRPPEDIHLGEPATVDLAITFRNAHSWLGGGYHDAVYRQVFEVLKPCGVLGVVQHRAAPGTDPATAPKLGYVAEEVVIAAAEAAGFVLAERSELLANPRDTRDHPEGVWNLPPSLRSGDVDRERYEAIGESDRMALRFVKPAAD